MLYWDIKDKMNKTIPIKRISVERGTRMKRKIALLAIDDFIARFFTRELQSIFHEKIDIRVYLSSGTTVPAVYEADLILYTDPSILMVFMDHIKCNCPVLMMRRTLTKEAVEKLEEIPPGSHCLVVNINSFMANETLATIYQLGLRNLKLSPYYKGCPRVPPEVDYIICHIDYPFLPDIPARKVEIGSRVFDINTILDILGVLDIEAQAAEEILLRYSMRIPSMWQGLNETIENRRVLSTQWRKLINGMSSGVMAVDEKDRIALVNQQLGVMLERDLKTFEKRSLKELVAAVPELEMLAGEKDLDNELFSYGGKKLILTLRHVTFKEISYGKLVIIENYTDVVKVQQKIHREIVGRGYYSAYRFGNIITRNPGMMELVEIARKLADASAAVVIFGESGTGKEMFAGAIHNYSHRSREPFVAVNCAALPENLLESELFGYEEGAFTGARKGGKMGLFESADGGTLFLDEIGEMPPGLQARLLRVLQEGEIMRVGGNAIIKVDTRIIAASNKNLFKMVEEGSFRRDLFYRLNVFHLEIPPLRERREDILVLGRRFFKERGVTEWENPLLNQFLQEYAWPGNVRELKNLVEYLVTIAEGEYDLSRLPVYLKDESYLEFDLSEVGLRASEVCLMRLVREFGHRNRPTGRRTLHEAFTRRYFKLSEMEIRGRIDRLEKLGYLEVEPGPRGCRLRPEGAGLLMTLCPQG